MNTKEDTLDSSIEFWAFLAPFFTLLPFLLLVFKATGDAAMPIIGLSGVLVCWKWRSKGLWLVLPLVFAAISYRAYQGVPDVYWQVGIGFALALSFVVTALSYEEVAEATLPLTDELKSKLKDLSTIGQKLRETDQQTHSAQQRVEAVEVALNAAGEEVKRLTSEQEILMQDLFEARVSAKKHEEELELVNAELERLRGVHCEQSQSLEEHIEAIRQWDEASASLQETNKSLKEELSVHQAMAHDLSEHIDALEREKKLLESTLARLQNEYEGVQQELRRGQQEPVDVSLYQRTIQELDGQLAESRERCARAQYQQNEYQAKLSSMRMLSEQCLDLQMRNENLVRERDMLLQQRDSLQDIPRDARVIEGKYQQLRTQFEEKTEALSLTRRELFLAQEQVESLKRDLQEAVLESHQEGIQKILMQSSAEIEALERAYHTEIERLHQIIRSMMH